MKSAMLTLFIFLAGLMASAQKNISFSFLNDYQDVYHLALIVYKPNGGSEVRVSDVPPGTKKSYSFEEGSALYLADYKAEAFAMQGNDIRKSGAQPLLVLSQKDDGRTIALSSLANSGNLYTSVLQQYAKEKNFSGTVLVADKGTIVYQGSIGPANRVDNIAIANQNKYRLASITKTFTAALVLQLVQEGKIDLKKTIGHYLPAYTGAVKEKATIHHLLTYSSGMENIDQGSEAMYALQMPVDTIIKKYCSGAQVSEPGKQMSYKNAEYILLGRIIEQVTGKSYETVLKERILNPLGMKHTGYLRHKDIIPGMVSNYTTDSTGRFYNDDPYWIENFFSSGAMYGTAADLFLFDQALFNNKLLKKETVDLMTTPYPELWGVAYSFWVSNKEIAGVNVRVMDRRGSISGSNAAWYHLLGRNQTIIVLANSNAGDVVELREKLAEVLVKNTKQ
jgi:teichoic acid D-alanine hydrolase